MKTAYDILDKVVDIIVPDVMAEDEKSFVNSSRVREGRDELAEIVYPVVDLDGDDNSCIGNRTKLVLIENELQ